MFKEHHHEQVASRNEAFVSKTATKIWNEIGSEANPYVSQANFCFGYNAMDLLGQRSFIDVFYLLFRGELPSVSESELLEKLLIAFINPGPRNPAVRAAMNAGIGKSLPQHILPIGLSVVAGDYLGVGSIEQSIRFFRSASKVNLDKLIEELAPHKSNPTKNDDELNKVIPGFGCQFGTKHIVASEIADYLLTLNGAGSALKFGSLLNARLHEYDVGWLPAGVVAATLTDLGFHPKMGVVLYQLITAPGLAAHGLEIANKPITAMPFVDDDNYHIEVNDE